MKQQQFHPELAKRSKEHHPCRLVCYANVIGGYTYIKKHLQVGELLGGSRTKMRLLAAKCLPSLSRSEHGVCTMVG